MAIFKPENLIRAGHRSGLPGQRHSVMVVDDVRANAAVMAAILRPHFHLIEAYDADEALALIEAMPQPQELACIVSDHRMPRVSGVELFERVRPVLPQTRRILVTAYMDMDALVDAINKGEIYRFVSKPFDAFDFLLTVRCAVAAFDATRTQAAYEHALDALAPHLPEPVRALREEAGQARGALAALEAQLRSHSAARVPG